VLTESGYDYERLVKGCEKQLEQKMDPILNICDSGIRVDPAELEKTLTLLEEAIDPDHREEVEVLQNDTFLFAEAGRIPVLVSTRNDVAHQSCKESGWPVFPFQRMWHDPAAMLLNELLSAYESVILKDDKVFTARPNLSQLFIPSFFGATGICSGSSLDDMPFINHVPPRDEIEKRIEQGIDIESSFMMEKYRAIIEKWKEIIAPYPRLSRWLHFALPDLQGPFNLYFLLRGSDAYIDLIDHPDLVDRLMKILTEIIAQTVNSLSAYLGETEKGYCWNYGYPGLFRNIDDNATLISREQYLRFVHPWNVQLMASCGGGIHHYCGDGRQIAGDIMSIPGVRGLNFGNPEKQDWDLVTRLSRETNTVLLWDRLIPSADLKKLPAQGLIVKAIVPDIETGRSYMNDLGRTA